MPRVASNVTVKRPVLRFNVWPSKCDMGHVARLVFRARRCCCVRPTNNERARTITPTPSYHVLGRRERTRHHWDLADGYRSLPYGRFTSGLLVASSVCDVLV